MLSIFFGLLLVRLLELRYFRNLSAHHKFTRNYTVCIRIFFEPSSTLNRNLCSSSGNQRNLALDVLLHALKLINSSENFLLCSIVVSLKPKLTN